MQLADRPSHIFVGAEFHDAVPNNNKKKSTTNKSLFDSTSPNVPYGSTTIVTIYVSVDHITATALQEQDGRVHLMQQEKHTTSNCTNHQVFQVLPAHARRKVFHVNSKIAVRQATTARTSRTKCMREGGTSQNKKISIWRANYISDVMEGKKKKKTQRWSAWSPSLLHNDSASQEIQPITGSHSVLCVVWVLARKR